MEPANSTVSHWSAGGWFGGQLGGTLWILIAAVVLMGKATAIGVGLLAIFVVLNIVGLFIWRRRGRLDPRRASLVYLPLVGLGGLGAIAWVDRAGQWAALHTGPLVPVRQAYALLALAVVGVMLLIFVRGRSSSP